MLRGIRRPRVLLGPKQLADLASPSPYLRAMSRSRLAPNQVWGDHQVRFFFFIPEPMLDPKGGEPTPPKYPLFRTKPGYQRLWRFYRAEYTRYEGQGFYRQKRITKYARSYYGEGYYKVHREQGFPEVLNPSYTLINWKYYF